MTGSGAASAYELSTSQCWARLRDAPIGRVALRAGDEIEVFPVNHVVDSGSIVFRTAAGTKLELIGDGAPCTFQADEIDVGRALVWSVMLKGTARPVRNLDDIVATFDMEVPTWHAGPKPTLIRIRPHAISGRRFPILPS